MASGPEGGGAQEGQAPGAGSRCLGKGEARPSEAEPRTGLREALGTHRAGPGWTPVEALEPSDGSWLDKPTDHVATFPPLGSPTAAGAWDPDGPQWTAIHSRPQKTAGGQPSWWTVLGGTTNLTPSPPSGGGVQAQVTPGGQLQWGDALGAEDIRASTVTHCGGSATHTLGPRTPGGAASPCTAARPPTLGITPQGQLLGPGSGPWQGL